MPFDSSLMLQAVVVAGVAFTGGAGLTFWTLRIRIRSDERERMRVDEHFFRNLKVEREFWEESRGYVFKEKWLVIRERLMYRQSPLSGWMQSERRLDETLDMVTIEKLAVSVSQLISEAPFSIKSIVRQLPQPRESAALTVSTTDHAGPKSL